MQVDKSLIKGSTTMLVLNLFNTSEMYGYNIDFLNIWYKTPIDGDNLRKILFRGF